MSGVFGYIDPTPSLLGECVPHRLAFGAGGGHTSWVERGGAGANSSEDARHCSVLDICQYFVGWVHALCKPQGADPLPPSSTCSEDR
jgi:hypothetical protein